MQDLIHIEAFSRQGERFEAHAVVDGRRMEVVFVREDGAVASEDTRYRHTLAADETRNDVLAQIPIAASVFRHAEPLERVRGWARPRCRSSERAAGCERRGDLLAGNPCLPPLSRRDSLVARMGPLPSLCHSLMALA